MSLLSLARGVPAHLDGTLQARILVRDLFRELAGGRRPEPTKHHCLPLGPVASSVRSRRLAEGEQTTRPSRIEPTPMSFFESLFKRALAAASEASGPVEDTDAADAEILVGNAEEDAGRIASARSHYEAAVHAAPGYWRAHLNLGNALRAQAAGSAAIASYHRAIELAPEQPGGHLNLGNALFEAGQPEEAAQSYRRAAELRPDWTRPLLGYANAVAASDPTEAEAALRKARAMEPDNGLLTARLAVLLGESGRHTEALELAARALERQPDDVPLLTARASLAAEAGEPETAVADWRRALELAPGDWATWSAYLFTLNFDPRAGADELIAEHARFGAEIARRIPAAEPPKPAPRADGRLRIAYLSPDFRAHPVANFIAPVLRHHDRNRFDIHCFQLGSHTDIITEELRQLAPHWHDVHASSDPELERQLRDNGIDILVDLAGHTAGNRLTVLARQPAPVQIEWLGYLSTTGLATIDWRLCDAVTDPPGAAQGNERPLLLPDAQWCYEPLRSLPDVGPLPFLANGHWTFGSFNQGRKLNRPLLEGWAALLQAVPGSRIRFVGIVNESLEALIHDALAAAGVEATRFDILGRVPIETYLDTFNTVDVALDTQPYSGATTTCDALLMGVPVATAPGARGISRNTASILHACGLDEWVFDSPDGLAGQLPARLADPQALAALRSSLREHFADSPVMDGEGFTRALEELYISAWQEEPSSTGTS